MASSLSTVNLDVYSTLNPDLKKAGLVTHDQLRNHLMNHALNDQRYFKGAMAYRDFNASDYVSYNQDLAHLSPDQLDSHWILSGRHEGRIYKKVNNKIVTNKPFNERVKIYNEQSAADTSLRLVEFVQDLYPGFNEQDYAAINKDVTSDYSAHWMKYGRFEGRHFRYTSSQTSTSTPTTTDTPVVEKIVDKLSFNVLIATIGKPTLLRQLASLKTQLEEQDYITIVYDGADKTAGIADVIRLVKGFQCNVNIFVETHNLGAWGHGIRNKYNSLPGDFVLNADDDDVFSRDAFTHIRQHCTNPDTVYIFKFRAVPGFIIYPDSGTPVVGNIGTPSGVIPTKYAKNSTWQMRYGGDGEYYIGLYNTYAAYFVYVPKITYICYK